jgi:hypothetical protein
VLRASLLLLLLVGSKLLLWWPVLECSWYRAREHCCRCCWALLQPMCVCPATCSSWQCSETALLHVHLLVFHSTLLMPAAGLSPRPDRDAELYVRHSLLETSILQVYAR